MNDILTILRALYDETRLRIIMLIEREELCVCEIMEILEMRQSRVSRHLNILKDAGLAESRRQGTWMYYRAVEQTGYRKQMIDGLKDWLRDQEVVKSDLIKLKEQIAGRCDRSCPE